MFAGSRLLIRVEDADLDWKIDGVASKRVMATARSPASAIAPTGPGRAEIDPVLGASICARSTSTWSRIARA